MGRTDNLLRKIHPTLMEMMLGIVLWGMIFALALCWFADSRVSFVLSLAAGALASVGIAVHMYVSIEDSLELTQDDAVKHMRRGTLLRIFAMMALFVLAWKLHGSIVGMFFGLFTLKLAAYSQPLIHRLRERILKQRIHLPENSEKGRR